MISNSLDETQGIIAYLDEWLVCSSREELERCLEWFKATDKLKFRRLVFDMESWTQEDRLVWRKVEWSKNLVETAISGTASFRSGLGNVDWLSESYPVPEALFPNGGRAPKGYHYLERALVRYVVFVLLEKGGAVDREFLKLVANICRVRERGYYNGEGLFDAPELHVYAWERALRGDTSRLEELLSLGAIGWDALRLCAVSSWRSGNPKEGSGLKERAYQLWLKESMPHVLINPQTMGFLSPQLFGMSFYKSDREKEARAQEWADELVCFANKGVGESELVKKHVDYLFESVSGRVSAGCIYEALCTRLEQVDLERHIYVNTERAAQEQRRSLFEQMENNAISATAVRI